MTEASVSHRKLSVKDKNKNSSEFYRHVILPSKTSKSSYSEIKKNSLTYEKQKSLKNSDIEKHLNSLQRQLCIDMLCQGYHKSFREFHYLLSWQKEDRKRSDVEHPFNDRPLLEAEPDKLRFLCLYLNKAEDAERKHQYSNMYKNYLQLASFFVKTNDQWLVDFFYEKCLSIVQTHSQLDQQLAAEAYLNIGLVYERKGDLIKVLEYFEKYRELSENYYDLKTNANFHLTRLYLKFAENCKGNEQLQYIIKAYETSIQSDDRQIEYDTCFKLGYAYLEENDIDSALKYFLLFYDHCQRFDNLESFGRISEALAICYQKKGNINKSTTYLEKYLEKVLHQEGDCHYAKACSALATIQITLNQYESAIESSSKAYSSSLANNNVDLDRDRVLYGIAKGLKFRLNVNDKIEQMKMNDLLSWKCFRTENSLTKSKT